MSIGSATATADLITGAATTAGAVINSQATGNAAQDQAQTAANALAFEKQQLAQKQGLLTPYETLGSEGGSQLAGLLGVAPPNPEAGTAGPTLNGSFGTPGTALTPPSSSTPQFNSPNDFMAKFYQASHPSATPSGTPTASTPAAPASNLATLGSGSPNASGTVQMLAPDGTVKAVPSSQVAYYQSLGAQVIQ